MQKKLKSVTRQMAAALIHSSRSLNLSEARDFCTGIYGPDGGIWEQSEYIPIMSYTVPEAVRIIAEYFADDIYPGDVIIHNDPFTGGNQTSDVKIIVPVFLQESLLCFVAINAHQADVGGAVAGGYNPRAREIWQEAVRITPLKLYEKGKLRRDVWDLIFANIRLPIVKEDIKPMVGACETGGQELEGIISSYGEDAFRANLDYLFDASESSMQAQLSKIPAGVYQAEQYAFGDGIDDNKGLRIALSLTIKDGRGCFDFSGTTAQTAGYVNAPYPVTVSGALFTLLMCMHSVYPRNQGMMRCIDFIIPEGTMLNPRFPAATGFGNHLTDQIGAVVFKALYPVVPERVTAGWNPLLCILLSGYDSTRERSFADMLINTSKGGSGATAFNDGWAHLGLIGGGGGITAQDPELFETENPVIFHRFELACDSGGVGKWRGGLGVVSTVELIDDGITLNIFGDGTRLEAAAGGLAGGGPGSVNSVEVIIPDGPIIKPNSKDLIGPLPRGTILKQTAGGGGGYGPPAQRAPELIQYDLRAGYISRAEAVSRYKYQGESD